MGATLDRNRPYGTVHGSDTGACFEQDHKEFDNQGKEIVKKGAAIAGKSADAGDLGLNPATALVTKDDKGNLFKDGEMLDTEAMEPADLRTLATAMGLTPHPNLGAAKAIALITEHALAADQLAQQLQ